VVFCGKRPPDRQTGRQAGRQLGKKSRSGVSKEDSTGGAGYQTDRQTDNSQAYNRGWVGPCHSLMRLCRAIGQPARQRRHTHAEKKRGWLC